MTARVIVVTALLVGAAAEIAIGVTFLGWLVTLAAVAGTAVAAVVLVGGSHWLGLGLDIARAAVAPDDETDLLNRREQAILARLGKVREEARVEALAPIREFHDRWGNTDGDDLDPLALWEDLGRLLGRADS